MRCGWDEIHPITNKVPIQLDHIDGNSENNSLQNLRLLCPNCHSLTPTFGILNKGNGREWRRLKRKNKTVF
jgi:5-methylcytosine-specific restriction endonuclease McrA